MRKSSSLLAGELQLSVAWPVWEAWLAVASALGWLQDWQGLLAHFGGRVRELQPCLHPVCLP
jgi:hypothetical protein